MSGASELIRVQKISIRTRDPRKYVQRPCVNGIDYASNEIE